MSTIIESIELFSGKMPVKVLFSYGAPAEFNFTILRFRSGDSVGYGEVLVPCPDGFADFLERLIGRDADALDHLLPQSFPGAWERIAHESVSIALHDLVARHSGISLAALLGGAGTAELPLVPCIFPHSPEEAGALAAGWRQRGFRYLKTKLVGKLEEDTARIRAIREAAPDLTFLQADANCGYHGLADGVAAMQAMDAAGLDIFEDPMDGTPEDYAELRRRVQGTRVKVMIDEFARETPLMRHALQVGAADVVNIHPDQPGSFTAARRNVQLAQAFGVPVLICGTGYTGIGSAAYQQLAAAILPGSPCGELGGSWDHGMPVNANCAQPDIRNGILALDFNTPGAGSELDEAALAPYITSRRSWRR